jgi:hypothetical protein
MLGSGGNVQNKPLGLPPGARGSNSRGTCFREYAGDIEIFLVHCPETGQIYAVPVEDVPANDGWLRVDPTRNGQQEGIRWPAITNCPDSSTGGAPLL